MPRILHTSDTHLGHQQYPRTDPQTGLNQREQDHYNAWTALIDAAVAEPPDAFIHAGDLFDGVRPSNRALAAAMDGFIRLSHAEIPTIIIAGNHEHPKMRGTGSPFRLFEHLDGVYPVFKGATETISLDNLTIHAVPQASDPATLRKNVAGIERGPGHNVLAIHGAVTTIDAFRNAEFNEQTLDPAWFDDRFDYVALGHYHSTTEITPNVWYCGAPDRVSIGEAGEAKGYLDVILGSTATFRALPVRPYADMPRIRAEGLGLDDVMAQCLDTIGRAPENAVCRLRIEDLDPALRGTFDLPRLRQAAGHLMHLEVRVAWATTDHAIRGAVEFGVLGDELTAYIAAQPVPAGRRERVQAMALQLLAQEAP